MLLFFPPTHVSMEEVVQLSLYFLLTVRVDGQQVADECKSVTACLIASEEEDEGLAYDLIFGHHPFLLAAFCRLVAAFCLSASHNLLICLINHIKLFQGCTLLTAPHI